MLSSHWYSSAVILIRITHPFWLVAGGRAALIPFTSPYNFALLLYFSSFLCHGFTDYVNGPFTPRIHLILYFLRFSTSFYESTTNSGSFKFDNSTRSIDISLYTLFFEFFIYASMKILIIHSEHTLQEWFLRQGCNQAYLKLLQENIQNL